MNKYRYSNLTHALNDKQSPLRQLLETSYPNTRATQAAYRAAEPTLLVEGGVANPGTVGAAFDYAMRFELEPLYDADLARAAFRSHPATVNEIDAVIVAAQVASSIGDRTTVYRAAWALALLTEVYRVGPMPGSPLLDLKATGGFTAQNLLALAPADAVRQLGSLAEIARTSVIPKLERPLYLGPTFDGSTLCAADADVIANGFLLDFKTSLGAKVARPGGRSDRLDLKDLYQLVSYALFDRSDTYRIRRVGIYSARFGHLVSWDLADLLEALAGTTVSVAEARHEVWAALGGS